MRVTYKQDRKSQSIQDKLSELDRFDFSEKWSQIALSCFYLARYLSGEGA